MNEKNENETRKYDFSYWVKPDIAESNFGDVQNEIKNFIEKLDGKIVKEKNIIRENLAYPIKHYNYGFLKIVLIEIAPHKVDEFIKYLKLNTSILRYAIGIADDIDIVEIKEFKKNIIESRKEKPVIAGKIEENKETKIKKIPDILPETPAIRQDAEPEKEKITIEDVDKKLEEILGREI